MKKKKTSMELSYCKYSDGEITFVSEDGDVRKEFLEFLDVPDGNKRKDSFWFDGEVARLGRYILMACGETKCKFAGDMRWYCDNDAVSEAYNRGLDDNTLHKGKGVVDWDMNNWFEVVGKSGETVMGDVAHEYDAAIEMLKEYYNDDILGEYERKEIKK